MIAHRHLCTRPELCVLVFELQVGISVLIAPR